MALLRYCLSLLPLWLATFVSRPPLPCLCITGASVSFTFGLPWWVVLAFLLLWATVTGSFLLLPLAHTPSRFTVPLFPLTPAAG